jgi:hypothetical protein
MSFSMTRARFREETSHTSYLQLTNLETASHFSSTRFPGKRTQLPRRPPPLLRPLTAPPDERFKHYNHSRELRTDLIFLLNSCRRQRNKMHAQQLLKADAITPFQLAEGAVNPSTVLPVDPEVTKRRLNFLLPTQDVGHYEESSSSGPREAEERWPLPDPERSLPSSESPPNVFRVSPDPIASTISSPSLDMAPAYRPRHRSDVYCRSSRCESLAYCRSPSIL